MTDTFHEISKNTKGRHTSTLKKMTLMSMAYNNEPRPSDKSSLGRSLRQYTYPDSGSYDPVFHKELLEVRPQWLSKKYDSNAKKQRILELASSGASRKDLVDCDLDTPLRGYTTLNNSSYDPDFSKLVRTVAPQWFKSSFETKKEALLALAQSGAPKPHPKTVLGRFLVAISTQGSSKYDPSLFSLILSISPSWQ